MSFKLKPQAFNIDSETYCIRTEVPKDAITDAMIAERVRNAGVAVGSIIPVQCFAPGYDRGEGTGTLLYEGSYRVTLKSANLKVIQVDDINSRQVMDVGIAVERVGEWHAFAAGRALEEADALLAGPLIVREPIREVVTMTAPEIMEALEGDTFAREWNPGRRLHEVWRSNPSLGGRRVVVFESKDKAEAQAVADGGPIPVVA